jgi:hypothetical protein
MKYALLIYEKPGALDGVGEQERSDMYGEYTALAEDSRCHPERSEGPASKQVLRFAQDDNGGSG